MRGKQIKFTIFFTMLATALVPLLFFFYYLGNENKKALRGEIRQQNKNYNIILSEDITSFIDRAQAMAETFLAINSSEPKTKNSVGLTSLDFFVVNNSMLSGVAFLDYKGARLAHFGARANKDYSSSIPSIIEETIQNGKVFIGNITRDANKKQTYLTMAFPAQADGSSARQGALATEINLYPLDRSLTAKAPQDMLSLVFTKNGFLIFSSQERMEDITDDKYMGKVSSLLSMAKENEFTEIEGDDYYGILNVQPQTGWLIYTEQPKELIDKTAMSFYKSPLKVLAFGILIIAAVIFLISLYLSWIILRPIKAMTNVVKTVADGNINNLPPLPAPRNEVGQLIVAFARMLDTIKIKFDDMEQDRSDLEVLNQSLELRVGSRTKELKTALNELIKKERLAAIGQMASIVSHEIKNPLAVMANSVCLIKLRAGDNADPKILKNIGIIEQEISQANGIIEEILGYARSREQVFTVVDINMYMKEILSSYPMPQNIKLTANFHEGPLLIRIDAEEMKQGIRNLIANAIEVLTEGGQIVVKTKFDKNKVILSIRDTGPGIPKEIQENIFAPFFTTKARGTGLGLAVVKKVCARNSADILLQSEVGLGTKFTIIFNPYRDPKDIREKGK